MLVFYIVSSVTALAGVNDTSADIFGVSVVPLFNALACISAVVGFPAEQKSDVPGASYYCLHSLLLLAFFADDSKLLYRICLYHIFNDAEYSYARCCKASHQFGSNLIVMANLFI